MTTPLDQTSVEKCRASASTPGSRFLPCRRGRAIARLNAHPQKHHEEGSHAGLDLDSLKKEPLDGLVNDPDASEQQQAGFDECRKTLDLAVAVLVIGVGWLVGDADRKPGLSTMTSRYAETASALFPSTSAMTPRR